MARLVLVRGRMGMVGDLVCQAGAARQPLMSMPATHP